jgi:hypothetical protein
LFHEGEILSGEKNISVLEIIERELTDIEPMHQPRRRISLSSSLNAGESTWTLMKED